MRRILLAFRAFFRTLFQAAVAEEVARVLNRESRAAPAPPAPAGPLKTEPARPEPARPKPARSEALTLLATLQREARFVDFVQEPLGEYSDAQVGAVVRDIHRDCGKVFERLFALQPVLSQAEGTEVDVPKGFDAGRYRLTGNVTGEPPFRGKLAHHGWEATKCELPAWSGTSAASKTVAAAEVELQ